MTAILLEGKVHLSSWVWQRDKGKDRQFLKLKKVYKSLGLTKAKQLAAKLGNTVVPRLTIAPVSYTHLTLPTKA